MAKRTTQAEKVLEGEVKQILAQIVLLRHECATRQAQIDILTENLARMEDRLEAMERAKGKGSPRT